MRERSILYHFVVNEEGEKERRKRKREIERRRKKKGRKEETSVYLSLLGVLSDYQRKSVRLLNDDIREYITFFVQHKKINRKRSIIVLVNRKRPQPI